ncbi:MAG: toll/interleukin-1 receptor domain-containing protein [Solobacterium sp.]|nr:toll/interleukin-1 receptor domain-containing protein [Solobacterium sp.]
MAGYSAKIPYEGDEKYIFISYSHKNKAEAESFIGRLQHDGYRVWYDEGIHPGSEWDEFIATHVENCALFFALMSAEYMQSDNCKDELNFARDLNKKRVLILLEEVEMPAGMRLRLGRLQNIHKKQYTDEEKFYQKTYLADGIDQCRDNQKADRKEADYVKTDHQTTKKMPKDNFSSLRNDVIVREKEEADKFKATGVVEKLQNIQDILSKYQIESEIRYERKEGPYINIGNVKSVADRAQFWVKENSEIVNCWIGKHRSFWYGIGETSIYRREWQRNDREIYLQFNNLRQLEDFIKQVTNR